MRKYKLLLAVFIYLFVPTVLLGQHTQVDHDLTEIMRRYNAVGLSVVVVKNNKIEYHKNYGYKNLETKTPLG
ncbi:MAG TPA: serine hydrolase, partial [Sphingobacterium sp.]|nr:serine hydrolase [Sphingobacterium sp.]